MFDTPIECTDLLAEEFTLAASPSESAWAVSISVLQMLIDGVNGRLSPVDQSLLRLQLALSRVKLASNRHHLRMIGSVIRSKQSLLDL